MTTPADSVDLWLMSSTGPITYLLPLVAVLALVRVAVSFVQRAGRAAS